MGMLALKRLISTRSERRRRQIRARARAGCVLAKRKEVCQHDGGSPSGKRLRYSGVNLPEDIWQHIHSLLPLRDAARNACVSHTFLQSWRYYPNLIFNKHILGSNSNGRGRDFIRIVDRVLKMHSGVNVKTLTLELFTFPEVDDACHRWLNGWLQITMRPGIEEIKLSMPTTHLGLAKTTYSFPCWLLSDRIKDSIRCVDLRLYVIDIKSPNLHVITLDVQRVKELSLGVSLKLKRLIIHGADFASYDRFKLLSNVKNAESLYLKLIDEVPPADMLASKFLHLRVFCLSLPGLAAAAYDDFSLVSLLDSCPSLEDFCLNVSHDCVGHETTNSEDPSHPRQVPGQNHGKLRVVTILGFCSAMSLVELTCDIVEMAASTLECLTLNVHGTYYGLATGGRMPIPTYKGMLTEAPRTLLAIRRYIQAKIPSTVKLYVEEPCGSCTTGVGH